MFPADCHNPETYLKHWSKTHAAHWGIWWLFSWADACLFLLATIMPGSRKMLRRYQSYGGKSQLPSYEGVMAEFTGWLGLQRSGQLYLTCNTQGMFSFSPGPVQACLQGLCTGSYDKASWCGKKHRSKFSCKAFNTIFSVFFTPCPSESPVFTKVWEN